jgi:hypothetical protein
MQLDLEYLRQHYASPSDEALLAVDRADLVETARSIFDVEAGRRKLVPPQDAWHRQPAISRHSDWLEGETNGAGEKPGWLEEASEVYACAVHSATAPVPDTAVDARDASRAAGIPCCLDFCEIPPEKSLSPYGTHRWRLLAPGKLSLQATSVVERQIGNPEFEAGWKALSGSPLG